MRLSPFSSRYLLPLRALALYALFLGAAWAALHLTSRSPLGLVLGPLAAQAAMALTIVVGSRTLLRAAPAAERTAPRRRLEAGPLVLIAMGGFLFQVSVLAGGRLLTTASETAAILPHGAQLGLLVLVVSSVVGAPLLEEVFFRGMLQPVLSRRNVVVGLVLTAALFGIAHGFQTPLRALSAFLQGLVLGGLMLLTGRLRAAMVVHALNNALVLAAALLLFFRPAGLLPSGSGGADPVSVPAIAIVAVGLISWGFLRLARQPPLSAHPATSPSAEVALTA